MGTLIDHPLYQNDDAVRNVSEWLLDRGYTVLQLFQMPHNEQEHSEWMLKQVGQCGNRILSLGSGVAGMEAYWKKLRPELEFELVNISQSQLDLSLCDGRKICADAEGYISDAGPFDIVILSYVLGHVDIDATLESAGGNVAPKGKLLIYDVFNGSDRFNEEMHYDTPCLSDIVNFSRVYGGYPLRILTSIPLGEFCVKYVPWVVTQTVPGLFIFEKKL
jgi:SAM-dependent methyltransferase